MSFLAQLQSQPWYSDVAGEFASLAPDVPAALWQGELLTEDSSLDPTAQDYKKLGHWGLFQESTAFPTTVGLPSATVPQLQNPQYNAEVAALAMEQAIKSSGATTFTAMVTALEKAGWPGATSAADLQTRLTNVGEIVSESGTPTPANCPAGVPGWLCSAIWSVPSPFSNGKVGPAAGPNANAQALNDIPGAIQNATNQVGAFAQQATQAILIGGIIVAVLGGGFLLLSQSAGVQAPMPVPVPV